MTRVAHLDRPAKIFGSMRRACFTEMNVGKLNDDDGRGRCLTVCASISGRRKKQ
jgi:hypothetical protein